MTQPPAAVQSGAWQPELGKDPISAKAEPGTFFPGRYSSLCSLDANAEMGMETGLDACQQLPCNLRTSGQLHEVAGQTLQDGQVLPHQETQVQPSCT